ncbi:MAG: Hsp20/alpha crystallin family protein [Desulfomonilia bacterium]|nr:Hsp20/alpha crystallin family protein [Pseudomonadota bacterium]HON37997.1 Hsp20/alpha crystallin family protein [Deltaproteobacteria bacterium]HRS55014.1 Hsp20/alpha crystallin family protein [Desulfomonilia bacterium]HPD20731.1 Hsp20/alpha crystallin family protein [Deltaproteobacteria bacterium]HPX19218.1 Hsp20/alpha crystallin family protein [Deltaproteobacteria bacterium]
MRSLTPWRWGRRSVPVSREIETHPLDMFQREMNRLFDDFFKGFGLRPFGEEMEAAGAFYPQVDMTEDENSIYITAELPGIDEKDIDINLSRDSLTIKGEKREEREEKGKESYYMERSFGAFSRVIPIPVEVNPDKAEATFKKGVLNITLPKVEKEKKEQRKIKIKGD